MNSPPTFEPILVVGLVDVHWGYDLDFGPWPSFRSELRCFASGVPFLRDRGQMLDSCARECERVTAGGSLRTAGSESLWL